MIISVEGGATFMASLLLLDLGLGLLLCRLLPRVPALEQGHHGLDGLLRSQHGHLLPLFLQNERADV